MIEQIYSRLICGGIGYSPLLFRVDRKYYTVRGDADPENYRKLAAMEFPQKRNGHALFLKHQYDNVITAGEFLQIIQPANKVLQADSGTGSAKSSERLRED